MLRLTDSSGAEMLCCCASDGGRALLCIGDPDQLESLRPVSGIIIDTTGPLQITNVRDAQALAAWLSAAAVWLRIEQMVEQLGDDDE